jgi:hypothetical protein
MARHDVDPTSLLFGLLFTIAGLWLLGGSSSAGTIWLGWTGPATAIGVGVLVVLAVRPRRSPEDDEGLEPTDGSLGTASQIGDES